jgi:hypothetical protein
MVGEETEYPLDLIVLSTGLTLSGAASPAEKAKIIILGRGGKSMQEKWATGLATLHEQCMLLGGRRYIKASKLYKAKVSQGTVLLMFVFYRQTGNLWMGPCSLGTLNRTTLRLQQQHYKPRLLFQI